MQIGEKDSRRYAADRPKECKHCYFWNRKRKRCSQKECYYLLSEKSGKSETMPGKLPLQESSKTGECQCCPYGKHSPCIGYCLQKIMKEMRQKKQVAGKEGNGIAGRSK